MSEFKLPDVGEGLTEAEIVAWKVKVGDVIEINDIVVEIETAKSLVELPSPYAGTVLALMVPEGETVAVGTPIIAIGDPNEAPAPAPAAPGYRRGRARDGDRPVQPARQRWRRGREPGRPQQGRPRARYAAPARPRPPASPSAPPRRTCRCRARSSPARPRWSRVPTSRPSRRSRPGPRPRRPTCAALAKPPVRKLAKDLGVDLATLTAYRRRRHRHAGRRRGRAGRREPRWLEEGAQRLVCETRQERETREPIKGVRKMMAGAMVQSAFSAPHVTEWITVDVTATMEFVERLKKRREFRDVKVSPLLVLSRAVMLAMRRTPEINSFWDEAAQEVVFKSYVNLGIAAATPRGLVVPNVKDAQDLSLLDLAGALNQLTATARDGKTQPAEMSGGTFTITNVGVFGVDAGTPIINPGESAILCFGAVRKQPWVVDDEIVVRQITTLALSFDHRHIDGEKGSRFLADVAGILEDPASALLF